MSLPSLNVTKELNRAIKILERAFDDDSVDGAKLFSQSTSVVHVSILL